LTCLGGHVYLKGVSEQASVRERILDAALEVLRDPSLKRLIQPRVAKVAGVHQGHLTYYFPRKRDLFVAVARKFADTFAATIHAGLPTSWHDMEAGERAAARSMLKDVVGDADRARRLLRLLVEADGDESIRDAIEGGVATMRAAIARALVVTEEDPEVELILATLWGLAIRRLVFRDADAELDDGVVERLWEWLDELATEEASGERRRPPPFEESGS
jgi:AcrR family transcriptional regulator